MSKKTYLYAVKYNGITETAEIDETCKSRADRRMKQLANAGTDAPSKYKYIGIQKEPRPFFFPDFSPIKPCGAYKKRKREAKESKEK